MASVNSISGLDERMNDESLNVDEEPVAEVGAEQSRGGVAEYRGDSWTGSGYGDESAELMRNWLLRSWCRTK